MSLHIIAAALMAVLIQPPNAAAARRPSAWAHAVLELFHAVGGELTDPKDQAALEHLTNTFIAHGTLATEVPNAWILLRFDREGALETVHVDARRLLQMPPLIQRAVVLHELEHVKSANVLRRVLDGLEAPPLRATFTGPPVAATQAPASRRAGLPVDHRVSRWARQAEVNRVRQIVRVLVDDEAQAYRRDIAYVQDAIARARGMDRYLETLPPDQRPMMQRYYAGHIQPVVVDGRIDEWRLRRDLVFLRTFPRRHARYYAAALLSEAEAGHVELRRDPDGQWHPARVLQPEAFLAWLAPAERSLPPLDSLSEGQVELYQEANGR